MTFILGIISGLLLAWSRKWIANANSRRLKRHALTKLLEMEFRTSPDPLFPDGLDALLEAGKLAAKGEIFIPGLTLSRSIPRLADDLTELDTEHTKTYIELSYRADAVIKGLDRLTETSLESLKKPPGEHKELDKLTNSLARVTAYNLIGFGKTAQKFFAEISDKKTNGAPQPINMDELKSRIEEAEQQIGNWPPMDGVKHPSK